jgi:hypothetical protein
MVIAQHKQPTRRTCVSPYRMTFFQIYVRVDPNIEETNGIKRISLTPSSSTKFSATAYR